MGVNGLRVRCPASGSNSADIGIEIALSKGDCGTIQYLDTPPCPRDGMRGLSRLAHSPADRDLLKITAASLILPLSPINLTCRTPSAGDPPSPQEGRSILSSLFPHSRFSVLGSPLIVFGVLLSVRK